mmetsp:Transcript_64513/g.127438  ORF Transcript_64513/g.127438 Transcript_64513/m.127438 type:complete len:233 (-) Transcript_64513:180-878(-)
MQPHLGREERLLELTRVRHQRRQGMHLAKAQHRRVGERSARVHHGRLGVARECHKGRCGESAEAEFRGRSSRGRTWQVGGGGDAIHGLSLRGGGVCYEEDKGNRLAFCERFHHADRGQLLHAWREHALYPLRDGGFSPLAIVLQGKPVASVDEEEGGIALHVKLRRQRLCLRTIHLGKRCRSTRRCLLKLWEQSARMPAPRRIDQHCESSLLGAKGVKLRHRREHRDMRVRC